MDRIQKIRSITVLSLAFIAIFFLAGSLSGLTLRPGLPFVSGSEVGIKSGTIDSSPEAVSQFPLLQGLFALTFVVVVVLLLVNLLSVIKIKNLILIISGLALLYGVIMLLPPSTPQQESVRTQETIGLDYQALTTFETTPLGTPPSALMWVVLGALLVGIIGLVWWRFSVFRREEKADEVLREAQQAVADLKSGQQFEHVIIRAYVRMSQALQEQRGIDRRKAMTAREFETLLVEKGVPVDPVRQLTRLFETVRYSPDALEETQQALALDSLDAIVRYCGGQAE
jgi:hypothetical protein